MLRRLFDPINPHAWAYFRGRPLDRLEMLVLHFRPIPARWRRAWFDWRLGRIP